MSHLDADSGVEAISPGDLDMLTQTLDVWCSFNGVRRSQATKQAKVLLQTYHEGRRNQLDFVDALAQSALLTT